MTSQRRDLEELATLYGLETSYHDGLGTFRRASDEALARMLATLGAPIAHAHEAHGALAEARRMRWQRVLEPVHVVWDDQRLEVPLRLEHPIGEVRATVDTEDGESFSIETRLENLPCRHSEEVSGTRYYEVVLDLARGLPHGEHRLTLEMGGAFHVCSVLAAPTRGWTHPDERAWGVFVPTYALRSSRSTGAGDLGDLDAVARWATGLGAGVIATLPLSAAFLDTPFEPSPYAPVSRMFWNELFLELERLPELARSAKARELLASPAFRREADALRAERLVDYRRAYALRRPVLEELAETFFADAGHGKELDRYLAQRPEAHDYARFRATTERHGESWYCWPDRQRGGELQPGDFDERAYRHHLYAQLRMRQQLDALGARLAEHGPGLYLDLPLGVHPDGYDAWRERSQFLGGSAAGAPPDPLFTKGQNWGFAPFHPRTIREDGYRYVRACLREQLGRAGMLRIDHVMWLHRIFAVPHGMDATEGVYVKYRPDELWAVLTLESHREECMIVGEDLGTVPDAVREAMDRHTIQRLFVLQYEIQPKVDRPIRTPPKDVVASLNTHDMPPFAAFWDEHDIADRIELGLLDDETARDERETRTEMRDALATYLVARGELDAGRSEDAAAVIEGALALLGASDVRVLLITLEDLWGEHEPQNVPGTSTERPNWRRKTLLSVEELESRRELVAALRRIDASRRHP